MDGDGRHLVKVSPGSEYSGQHRTGSDQATRRRMTAPFRLERLLEQVVEVAFLDSSDERRPLVVVVRQDQALRVLGAPN